jgi:hypothetical protein
MVLAPLTAQADSLTLTLDKASQNLTARLQKRVPSNNLQKALETLAAVLDHIVAETVGEDLAGQWGYRDSCTFALEDIAEVLEVGVPAAHHGMLQFESGDVGSAHDLVRRVHIAGGAMGLGIADLFFGQSFDQGVCVVRAKGVVWGMVSEEMWAHDRQEIGVDE